MADKIYSPRERIEWELHMTEEEKEHRRQTIEKVLADHDAAKLRGSGVNN